MTTLDDESLATLDDDWSLRLDAVPEAPLHVRVAQAIGQRIEQHHLPPGAMLPPELELARQFGVSRHTMRAALDALVRGGRLERHRGRGTFVTRPPIQQSLTRFYSHAQEMRERGAQIATQVLARRRLRPDDALWQPASHALGASDAAVLGYLLRLRLVDGSPLLVEHIVFPVALNPALLAAPQAPDQDLAAQPFYEVIAAHSGVYVTGAHEVLRAAIAHRPEARQLGVLSGAPVFEVERTSYAGEQPVEWRRTLARADRFTYAVDLMNPTEDGGADNSGTSHTRVPQQHARRRSTALASSRFGSKRRPGADS